MEILAKPSGITLRDHRQHVYDEALHILEIWPFLSDKYARITGKDLRKSLREAAWWHDLGKEHHMWQGACQEDYKVYQSWRKVQGWNPNALDPDQYRKFSIEKRKDEKWNTSALLKSGLRHEFASLQMMRDKGVELSQIVQVAIAAHHGKLNHRHEKRWRKDGIKDKDGPEISPFFKHWEDFLKESNLFERTNPAKWEKRLMARYEYAGVRALLQLADTRASRAEGGEDLPELDQFSMKIRYNSLRPVQQAALALSDEKVSILRAPTGSGKTYGSLLWAEQQIQKGRADRLVIAMPTRFTSNALAIGIEENIGESGLYHSSAWFTKYGHLSDHVQKSMAREHQIMAQILATPVTVCTIDHLLMSLTGTKENHHSTFFFLANSAVVFDEADFYDPFVQANLVVLIRALKRLEVPVLIMSATVPDSARKLYQISHPIVESEDFQSNEPTTESLLKPERCIKWAGGSEFPEDSQEILKEMVEIGAGIIYANTVARAILYHQWFKKHHPNIQTILYHSRFTEADKKEIEKQLLDHLGKEVWEKTTDAPKAIAILTQIGEMSVNISTPIMLTDLCPWDRLAQRIGRLNRFGENQIGTAYVIEPLKKGETYVAPYGELIKRKWIPSKPFLQTLNDLSQWPLTYPENRITPEELVKRVNALYPKPPDFTGSAQANQMELIQLMNHNWMIVPHTSVNEEDATVSAKWKSRHIPPQQTVFVKPPEGFDNYHEYQRFALEYGVSCPTWMIEKEMRKPSDQRKLGKLERLIGDEETDFYYTSFYDSQMGMAFFYETHQKEEDNDW